MRLARGQSYALLERFGCYVTHMCDKCGKVLAPVSYTRKGESGEWCSAECRGDISRLMRRGGRPQKYRSREEKRAAKTRQQQVYRANGRGVEKTLLHSATNKELAGAKNASLVVPPYPADFEALAP